jgi:hypothetical protein
MFSILAALVWAQNAAVYPIDPTQRGSDLVTMFSKLSVVPYKTYQSEIALQTTDTLIRNVQQLIPAPNSTLFAINFYPAGETILQTTIVFTEKIQQMVYSPYTITGTSYTPGTATNVIPYYPMSLSQRGADIQSMVATLKNSSQLANVTLSTTLTGNYYEAIPSGVIPNVQNVTILLNTMLLVAYNRPYAYVIVAPDQITAINYEGPAL